VASPRQQLITDALVAHLGNLTGISVFRGEVTVSPPVVDETGRIAPYVVLYAFGKAAGPEVALDDDVLDLTYTCQITCAAAFEADCEYVVDQVDASMNRWTPTVSGVVFGRFRPPSGYTPPIVHRDDTVKPVRFTVPLQYRITATT
jgi:hypothetical protein